VFFLGYVAPIHDLDDANINFGGRQIVDYGFGVAIMGNIAPAHVKITASRIYCRRNPRCETQKTNSNEKGDGWVDLEMRLGWPRCAPAERLLQMLATVGLKGESDRRSGGPEANH
jgi:hypothetical protein